MDSTTLMNRIWKRALFAWVLLCATCSFSPAQTIQFSGFSWTVRSGRGGPGPNVWAATNVWVDPAGHLHLRIASREGKWSCAEVTMQKRLGFGRYEFQITGRLDQLDDNVVLGLFNYPTRDVGPDATHEIDIEFARWGDAKNPMGNYVVWPVERERRQQSRSFPFELRSEASTHRFTWSSNRVVFESLHGNGNGDGNQISQWIFAPEDASRRIAQQPMPVHINLWLFKGQPPKNGKEVEIVVRRFDFTAE